MTRVFDPQKRESRVTLDRSRDLAIHMPGPELFESELEVSVPRKSVSPGPLAQPVTDNVVGSGVDKHREPVLQHKRHISLGGSEGVSGGVKEVGHIVGASVPGMFGSNGGQHPRKLEPSRHAVRFVVAAIVQRRLALFGNVVGIDVEGLVVKRQSQV